MLCQLERQLHIDAQTRLKPAMLVDISCKPVNHQHTVCRYKWAVRLMGGPECSETGTVLHSCRIDASISDTAHEGRACKRSSEVACVAASCSRVDASVASASAAHCSASVARASAASRRSPRDPTWESALEISADICAEVEWPLCMSWFGRCESEEKVSQAPCPADCGNA